MRSDDELDRSIGERIKAARQHRKMTLTALASQLGLTHQQVQKYETGRNRISATMLFRTADSLGFDLAFFFSGCAAAVEGRTVPVDFTREGDGDLRAALERIQDDEVRTTLAGLLQVLEGHPTAPVDTRQSRP